MSEDGKSANDEKPAASSKLESMPPDELIKLFKSQVVLKKKLDSKISELSTANISLCQTQEQLQNELEDEQSKRKHVAHELDQCKIHESELQQELNTLRESSDCFQQQNESLKLSCKNLQDEILSLQNDKSNLLSKLTDAEEDFIDKLNETKSTIENLRCEKQSCEQENLHLKQSIGNLELEINDFKMKSNSVDKEKQSIEEELHELRLKLASSDKDAQLIEELNDLKLKSNSFEKDKQLIEEELNDLRSKLSTFDKDNNLLEEELNNLRSKLNTFEINEKLMEEELKNLRSNVNSFDQNKQLMEDELHDLRSKLNISDKDKYLLQEDLNNLRLKYGAFDDEKQMLEEELNSLRSTATSFDQNRQLMEDEVNDLKTKLITSDKEKKLMEEELNEFRSKSSLSDADLQSREEELNNLRVKSRTFDEEKQMIEQELDDLRSKLNRFETDKKLSEEELDDLKTKLITSDKEKHSMEEELNELKSKSSSSDTDMESTEKEINNLRSTLSKFEMDKQLMDEELNELRTKSNSFDNDKQIMEEERNDLRSKLNTSNQEKHLMEQELNDLQSKFNALEKERQLMEEELTDLRLRCSTFDQNRQSMEEELTELRSKVISLDSDKELLERELNDLKSKFNTIETDKQLMEEDVKNYRKQIENFEMENLELRKIPQQLSDVPINQLNENFDEIISQRIDSFLNHNDDETLPISKLLSDIPALLQSSGITNYVNEDFPTALNLECLLRLCSLLIERCHVLQSINVANEPLLNKDLFSIIQNGNYEQCQLLIHRQDHPGLDALFEHFQSWINQSNDSNDWEIRLSKPIDQSINQYIRLEFNDFKFISDEIEHELRQSRIQLDQSLEENKEQRCDIAILKENLHSFEELKQQYAEQCDKINELQMIIDQENIDKTKFDQLESLYEEVQQKYVHLEHIKSECDVLQENFNKTNLQLQDQQEKHQIEINSLQSTIEQQKQIIDNATQSQDERYSSSVKLTQQLSDLLETEKTEKEKLKNINQQLENDLQTNNELFFEKTKQADDLDKQLQIINNEYQDLKVQFDQIKHDKDKLINDINLLAETIQSFDSEKSENLQIINKLEQDLESNKLNFDQLIKQNKEENHQEKAQIETKFQQTIESLKQELDSAKNDLKILQLQSIEQKQSILENEQIQTSNLRSELENFQKENETLNQTINELNNKLATQKTESNATIQDLQEKQQKMKMLLSRLKKELQEKHQQPKQSLIDLELADYEKTIKSLKDNLTSKDKEIQDVRDELTNINEKNRCLMEEIQNLDQQKLQTEERANKFKTLLDATKRELQDAKDLEQQRYQNDDNLRSLLDKLKTELDDNKVTVSQLLSEKQELTERFNNQSDTNQRTINLLEQNLRIAKHDLEVVKQDYDTLQDDFNNYKIRAQSVLKQQQSTQRERMPIVPDKQTEFEETIEKLKIALREANNKIQLLISENETLQKEQDRLNEVQTKIVNESRKREQDLRKQHQIELEKMESDCSKRTNDSHDMMKSVTIQNEILSTTYQEQIATIQTDNERSISILQNQLQTSKQEIEQLKNRIESLRQTNADNEKESSQVVINNEINRDEILWTYAERQQGEGSESASVDFQSSDVAVKTLENVLFGNANSTRPSQSNMDKPRHILFEDVELERQRIEEELNKTKYRLLNTTELLNESELTNVRLSEQVSLLKDEIRRIERNMDRAESISNLEYLKNIILKFFILKSAHERLQIIPVLVTMLKLSPDEQAKLVRVAQETASVVDTSVNNESNTQPVTSNANSSSSSSSWGSYLNIW